MKKPLIGVMPLYDKAKNSYWMIPGYMQGLENAGAIPIILPLTTDTSELIPLAELCDGFLFTGGQDVSPNLYGEEAKSTCGEVCNIRDEEEKLLLQFAVKNDKSVLGICRGIQFINVALGGTLYQDLRTEHPSDVEHHMSPPYNRVIHTVSIIPNTPLAQLLQTETLGVNSYHHQAIKTLAPSLEEMARSEDGLIEAVRMPDKKFIWAVQWHPELSFLTDENSRKIFDVFISTAKKL